MIGGVLPCCRDAIELHATTGADLSGIVYSDVN
jgi:hypothetical protein